MLKLTPDEVALIDGLLASILESGPSDSSKHERTYLAQITALRAKLAASC